MSCAASSASAASAATRAAELLRAEGAAPMEQAGESSAARRLRMWGSGRVPKPPLPAEVHRHDCLQLTHRNDRLPGRQEGVMGRGSQAPGQRQPRPAQITGCLHGCPFRGSDCSSPLLGSGAGCWPLAWLQPSAAPLELQDGAEDGVGPAASPGHSPQLTPALALSQH